MIRRPPRSTPKPSSAASDVYKRQVYNICMNVALQSRSTMTEKQEQLLCTQQQYCCISPQVVGILRSTLDSYPGTPRNRQASQLALWRGASRTARNLLILGRAASDPSTTAWRNPMSLGSKIDQPQQKKFISGATAFRLPRHQPLAPRPTLLSYARAAAMCSIELVCCAPSTRGRGWQPY